MLSWDRYPLAGFWRHREDLKIYQPDMTAFLCPLQKIRCICAIQASSSSSIYRRPELNLDSGNSNPGKWMRRPPPPPPPASKSQARESYVLRHYLTNIIFNNHQPRRCRSLCTTHSTSPASHRVIIMKLTLLHLYLNIMNVHSLGSKKRLKEFNSLTSGQIKRAEERRRGRQLNLYRPSSHNEHLL